MSRGPGSYLRTYFFNPSFFFQSCGHTWITTNLNDHFQKDWLEKSHHSGKWRRWGMSDRRHHWQERGLERSLSQPTELFLVGPVYIYSRWSTEDFDLLICWVKGTSKAGLATTVTHLQSSSPTWIVLNSVLPCKHTITGLSLDTLRCNFTPGETEHYIWFTFSWTKHTHWDVRYTISLSYVEYYSILLLGNSPFLLMLF